MRFRNGVLCATALTVSCSLSSQVDTQPMARAPTRTWAATIKPINRRTARMDIARGRHAAERQLRLVRLARTRWSRRTRAR